MKIRKISGAALMAMYLITGCAANPMAAVYDNNQRIASETNTYGLDKVDQAIEDGHFTAGVEKMEGMDTIWVLDAEKDTTLDITYTLNVFSGKMKLVLINPEDEISVIAECDTETTEPVQSTLNIEKGNNRIKIVADKSTKFDIDISISGGSFENLGMISDKEAGEMLQKYLSAADRWSDDYKIEPLNPVDGVIENTKVYRFEVRYQDAVEQTADRLVDNYAITGDGNTVYWYDSANDEFIVLPTTENQ